MLRSIRYYIQYLIIFNIKFYYYLLGIGHPIVGDGTYGPEKDLEVDGHVRRMALHAFRLILPYNATDGWKIKETVSVEANDRFESFDYF